MASSEKSFKASHGRRLFTRRRVLVATCLVAATMAALWLLVGPGRDAGARLAAIDAAHAVPEERNAAKEYTQFILDGTWTLFDPYYLPQNAQTPTLAGPWRSTDFPEVAKWIQGNQVAMDTLLKAGRKPQCWFPLYDPQGLSGTRWAVARCGTLLLLRAANNDLAEGRTQAGLEKLLCVFQTAGHYRVQMSQWDHLAGVRVGATGLKYLDRLLVMEDLPPEWLARFEAVLPPVADVTDKDLRQLHRIEDLRMRAYGGLHDRVKQTYMDMRFGTAQRVRQETAAHVAESRATRILLALRRHKDRTGAWPVTLAEIEGQVPPEALIDPVTGKPFVYRPPGDSLLLYTVGPNGTDEGGESGDDYRLWPPSKGRLRIDMEW